MTIRGSCGGFRVKGFLYSSPHNVGVKGYKRVKDWLEVEKLFLG